MKKTLFLLAFFMLFSGFTTAQTPSTTYCQDSLLRTFGQNYLQATNLLPEQVSNSPDCICWSAETQFSLWRNLPCKNGFLEQERDIYNLIPPNCSISEKTLETQQVRDARCDKCVDPVYSEPVLVGCWSKGRIEGKYYSGETLDTQGNCISKNGFQLSTIAGACTIPELAGSSGFWFNGLGIVFIVLAIIIVAIVLYANRKKIKKAIH